jgi:hypothetical protein
MLGGGDGVQSSVLKRKGAIDDSNVFMISMYTFRNIKYHLLHV